jgi:hypothetical protein
VEKSGSRGEEGDWVEGGWEKEARARLVTGMQGDTSLSD